nr:AsmA-like C-terminal domain-containing protein [Roseospira navarrensis]
MKTVERTVRRIGAGLGVLVLLFVLGAWTLSRGPLTVPFLLPSIERALAEAVADAGLDLAVAVEAAALEWRGPAEGLDITLRGVRIAEPDGTPVARVGRVAVSLDGGALIRGEVALSRLTVVAPDLRVVRAADGSVSLGLGPPRPPGPPGPTGSDAEPPPAPHATAALPEDALLDTWDALAGMHLALQDARLLVDDRTLGRSWQVRLPEVVAGRGGDGSGSLTLEASLTAFPEAGPVAAEAPGVDIALRHDRATGETAALLAVAALNPARHLAEPLGVPALAGWDQRLDGTVTLDLTLDGDPADWIRFARIALVGRAGTLALPAPIDRTYDIRSLVVDATAEHDADPRRLDLTLNEATLGLDGATLRLRGAASDAAAGRASGVVDVSLTPVTMPVIARLWPGDVARGALNWMAPNLSDGLVVGTGVRLGLEGPTLADLDVASLSGDGAVMGMTVNYLDGLPPATGAHGRVMFGLDAITLDIDGGGVGALKVTDGDIAFTGFDADVERADMTFDIVGPLTDAMALIDNEPLGYASQVGIDPAEVGGAAETTLTLGLPLLKDLPLEALEVRVQSQARGVSLPGVALGQDLTAGDLALDLTGAGMDVTGRATLGGVPVRLDWRENFTDAGDFDRRYRVEGRVDNAGRAAFRLDGGPFQPPILDGPVDAVVTYTETRGEPGRLDADVDLTPARLALDPLGWGKAPGVPGRAAVTGAIAEDSITVDFDVTTAAAGDVAGRARLSGAGDLRRVDLDRVRLGPETDLRASVEGATGPGAEPGASYAITLEGHALDLRAALAGDDDPAETAAGAGPDELPPPPVPSLTDGGEAGTDPGPALTLRLALDRLLLTDTVTLAPVEGTAVRDAEGHWRSAQVAGRVGERPGGGPSVSLRLTPQAGTLTRTLSARSGDAGAVAAALGVTDRLRGGTMTLNGTLDAEDRLTGTLRVDDFSLTDAPVLARILAVAALTGILDEMRGSGLTQSTLVAPFTYADSVLTLREARTNGPSLGLTANGALDLERDTLDLRGVVVPLYLVNAILGEIPLLGDILVGEEGGGIFAVGYTARGPMDDPAVSVNPLTVLTPGILRGVFGDGSGPAPGEGGGSIPSAGPGRH